LPPFITSTGAKVYLGPLTAEESAELRWRLNNPVAFQIASPSPRPHLVQRTDEAMDPSQEEGQPPEG
jgi:hypothetical protein